MDYKFQILDDTLRQSLPVQSCTEAHGLLVKWQMMDGSNALQSIVGLEALLKASWRDMEMTENNCTCSGLEVATALFKFQMKGQAYDAANFIWRNKDYYQMKLVVLAMESISIDNWITDVNP